VSEDGNALLSEDSRRRLRLAVARLRVWVGRRSLLPDPTPVLPAPADLPGQFIVMANRRWRAGLVEPRAEAWSQRLRQQRALVAWRSFASDPPGQWLWVQASFLATPDDAVAAASIPFADLAGVRNPGARVVLAERRKGPALRIPADLVQTIEDVTDGAQGRGVVRYVHWAHRGALSTLCATSKSEPWPWEQLTRLASAQSARVDAIVGYRR